MLAPLARQARANTATTRLVAPPVGGWNTRDAFAAMPDGDALLLDNWFPRSRDVVLRRGYALHCDTEETGHVVGLAEHASGNESALIAFVAGKAIDVSTAAPSTLATGLDVGAEVFSWNFKGRSFHANGVDAVQSYDGTTFESAALAKDAGEGETFDASKIAFGMGYGNRLYLGGDGNLGFWYGAVNAVTGAMLHYFPLDGVLQKGGYLAAMGALSDDDGAGRNDFAVFVSSKGQVALYRGTDPGEADGWAIVGVYDIGEPVSRFGVIKFGADLVVLTKDGYVPLSAVLSGSAKRSQRFALSDKIVTEAADVIERYRENDGWRVIVYPKSSMLIVNIPRSAQASDQHVMNTVTGAWCRFRNIPAVSFAIFDGDCYFGARDGKVYKFDTGVTDAGEGISADAKTAWSGFTRPAQVKQFTLAQPIFVANAAPFLQIGFAVDFGQWRDSGFVQALVAQGVGIWDQGVWNQAIWAGVAQAQKRWVGLYGTGYLGSLRVRVAEAESEIAWTQTAVMFKPGGPR